MRTLLSREDIYTRLDAIFPRAAFDPALSSPLAAAAVFALLYVDAISDEGAEPERWARPLHVLAMSDVAAARSDEQSRVAFNQAASQGRRQVEELHESWGAGHTPWYADGSREPLRDETFPGWASFGAMHKRPGVPTNSPLPTWALDTSFADLFDPELTGEAFEAAIEAWRDGHMTTTTRVKIQTLQARARVAESEAVILPNGQQRILEPGGASRILKGVIESWAQARLYDAEVLAISQPGDKVYVADQARLAALGLRIDVQTLLPDLLIMDIGAPRPTFWIIEVVWSDGEISDARKEQLLAWARESGIEPADCQFLTAFESRRSGPARKRLPDLASDTYAWYLSEPLHELAWTEIERATMARVVPIRPTKR